MTTNLINNLDSLIKDSNGNSTKTTNLNSLMTSVRSSCIADTKNVSNLLDSYRQISNLMSPGTCSSMKSNFEYLGKLGLGEWLNNLDFELPSSLDTAMNMLNSGCSIFKGIMNLTNIIKSFSLDLYKLVDILKSNCNICDYGDLYPLINQTTDYNFNLPSYYGDFGKYSIDLLTHIHGNTEIPSFNNLTESDFNSYIKDTNSHYYTIYNMGVRYGDELIDAQSSVINGLIQMAGDIASDNMQKDGTCSLSQYTDKTSCELNGGIWTLNSSEIQLLPNIVKTFYADDRSGAYIKEANYLDYLELRETGKIYVRTNIPLPEDCSNLSIEGFDGDDPNHHWILSKKTKDINVLSDDSTIQLSDILDLIKRRDKIIYDYNNYKLNLENSFSLYQDEYSKLQETNISETLFKEFDDFLRQYEVKPNNLNEKYNTIFQNIIGKLNWIIEAGEIAKLSSDGSFTKDDGLIGNITMKFPLYSYKGINDEHSNIRISTDITYKYSFNKDIKEFYDELLILDNYLTELNNKTIEARFAYRQFQIADETLSKIFTGKVVNGLYPGKYNINSIRVADPKYFLSYTKPHIEILRDTVNLPNMNNYHGDVWCDLSEGTYNLWMYLRTATITEGLFNYKWIKLGETINISFIDNLIEKYTVDIDTSLFFNFEEKTNSHFSQTDPSIDWNTEVQKWINVGDIWLTLENDIPIQKIFTNNGSDFEWINLASNNAPMIAPTTITLDEDTNISGNLLTNFYDNQNDNKIKVDTVFLPLILGGPTQPYTISETDINVITVQNLGTFSFKTTGEYLFSPLPNKYTSILSYRFRVIDSKNNYSMGIFNIEINPVNDAPLVSGPLSKLYLTSDANSTIDLLSNATDIDNDLLYVNSLEKISGPDIGTSITRDYINPILDTTKMLYIKPSEYIDVLKRDEIKSFSFAYDVTDTKSYTPTSIVINFKGVNHSPVITNNTIEKHTLDDIFEIDLNNFIYDYDGDICILTSTDIKNDPHNSVSINNPSKIVTVNPKIYDTYLSTGQTQNIIINYNIDDEHNGLAFGVLNINITK